MAVRRPGTLETNVSYPEAVGIRTTPTAPAEAAYPSRRPTEYDVVVTDAAGDPEATFPGRLYRPTD